MFFAWSVNIILLQYRGVHLHNIILVPLTPLNLRNLYYVTIFLKSKLYIEYLHFLFLNKFIQIKIF